MSSTHEGSPERLPFAPLSRSYEANIKIILDDLQPIETRIQAIGGAELALHRASAEEVFPVNGVRNKISPDIEAYFKALIFIAKERMSKKNAFMVLKYVHAAINRRLVLDLDCTAEEKYIAFSAPFFAEICSNTIKALIEFRNDSDIVCECGYVLQHFFCGKDFPEERMKCRDIAVASGLIPTLANILTSPSIYVTVDNTASSEKMCSSALHILAQLLAMKWSEPPVSILVETAHPVFQCLLNSSKKEILFAGSRVILRLLSGTLGKKTIELKFKDGKTGLQYVLLVIDLCSNFMKTRDDCESMMMDVLAIIRQLAWLIIHREDLKALSKIMLNMLEDFESASLQLLLIFADLMDTKCEGVLNSLSELATSTPGKNYMREVIEIGFCGRYESFREYQRGQTRVKQALLKIYHYGIDEEGEDEELPREILEAVRAHIYRLYAGGKM